MPSKRSQKPAPKARSRARPAAAATPRSKRRTAAAEKVAQIQQVIEVMVQHGAVEVELEEAGTRLRVRLKEEPIPVTYAAPSTLSLHAPAASAAQSAAPAPGAASAAAATPQGEVFKSPMLGTFYRSPSPEAEAFVKVGDRVSADSTICIIEAMKVMNEIKAEREFEVLDVLVRNGDPVEYGQPLFLIRS